MNATTGTFIWNYTTGDRILYTSPAVVNDKVYVGSEDKKIYCLNETTGSHVWNYSTYNFVWSSPAVADNKVYAGSDDDNLYCLDALTGTPVWSYLTDHNVISSPAIADGKVFVGSFDAGVYAFGSTGIHDIAVTDITPTKTVVASGSIMEINVTVENQGDFTEAFSVTLYANSTPINIEEELSFTLVNGESETRVLGWNTTNIAKGNYTITMYAWSVTNELDLADNVLINGWIIVSMIGDITGPDGWPDGKCDMRDVGLVARYFGQDVPPAPANCDVTGPTTGTPDGKIDMRDIGLVARHFGETDP
jgi:hypothetical protein